MSRRTFIGTLVVFVICGLAVGLDFFHEKNKNKNLQMDLRLLDPSTSDQISEIIVNKQGQVIHLEKTIDGWMVKQPVVGPADNAFIDQFIKSSVQENALDIAASWDQEQKDLKVFGLDPALGSLEFIYQNKQRMTISVSHKQNFERNAIIRRNQEQRVFIVPNGWFSRLHSTVFDFQEKRVFRHGIGGIDEVFVRGSYEQTRIKRIDGQWGLPADPSWKVDLTRTLEFLNLISGTQFKQIYLWDDFVKLKKEKMPIRLGLIYKDQSWDLEIFRDKQGLLMGSVPSEKIAGVLDAQFVQSLSLFGIWKLRSLRLPFEFDADKVQRMELQWKGKTKSLQKTAIGEEGKYFEELLRKARDSRAADYLEPKESRPAKSEQLFSVKFFEETNNAVFDFKVFDGKNSKFYGTSSLFKDGFIVNQGFLDRFELDQHFSKDQEEGDK